MAHRTISMCRHPSLTMWTFSLSEAGQFHWTTFVMAKKGWSQTVTGMWYGLRNPVASFITNITCFIMATVAAFYKRISKNWGIRVRQCDISWTDLKEQKLTLCTVGWLTSEACFENWKKSIRLPFNEPCAVVEDGSWSRLSIASMVINKQYQQTWNGRKLMSLNLAISSTLF